MYSLKLSPNFITDQEKLVFKNFIHHNKLEDNIWDVFESLFNAKTKATIPLMLRAYEGSELVGAAIILKCMKTGKALFSNKLLAGLIDSLKIPVHIWLKFGCCMDMLSNTGFVKDPDKRDEIISEMINFLQSNKFLTIINDYTENSKFYKNGSIMPSLPHGFIDTSELIKIEDYTSNFKNIRKKNKEFRKKGGEYLNVSSRLDPLQLNDLKKCFISTARNSVFYLPYQDLYLKSAIETSKTEIGEVYYFVAQLEGEFVGYQAAIKTGKHLNALHGAFDRTRKTNYHAYDILFVKMVEFAIENGLQSIDFGAVLNYTKQKMINKSLDMSYFVLSRYSIVRKLFSIFLKITKIQGKHQLKFRN